MHPRRALDGSYDAETRVEREGAPRAVVARSLVCRRFVSLVRAPRDDDAPQSTFELPRDVVARRKARLLELIPPIAFGAPATNATLKAERVAQIERAAAALEVE